MAIQQILVVSLIVMATMTAVAQPVNVTNLVRARDLAAGPSIDLLKPDDDEQARNIANIFDEVAGLVTGIPIGGVGDVPEGAGAVPGDAYNVPADAYGGISGDMYDAIPDDVLDALSNGTLPDDVLGALPDDVLDSLPDDVLDALPEDEPSSTPTYNNDPIETPSRTSPEYSKLTIGCRAKGCDSVVKIYDVNMPMPTHSCPRDALAALAKWRLFCDRPPKFLSGLIQTEPNCWSKAPSIDRCCGEWVREDDPKYQRYPSRYIPTEKGFSDDTYIAAWVAQKDDHGNRRIVKPGWHEYNVKTDRCQFWRSEDDLEFAYFINTLQNYGIWDVDETGKILGQTAYNAEGVSPGPLIPGSDSELDISKD
ncbi:uncharacterized protein Z520_05752 [Fonsecaea multimorphosa CBS 102226]|uniref:Uncharacterized protein n=1 Tax=Fonsecaea multimorphosa CBS 102226 TaxID=1442371 RepID=A0A0D2IN72_9EURO|nr:uncharacterized protein Z520_05752 [Fonsecaea multimorphosa CBS 102226]KIX98451.1 hypothetical protein Z520_05752 [Fonsecaea multimorphosa CBS 102226]OAL24646.1 hypothetical protein AYO22_05435 [Fonsecaea multimorphosa]